MNKTLLQPSRKKTLIKMIIAFLIIVTLCLILIIKNTYELTYPNGLGLSQELERYKSPTGKYSMLTSAKWTVFDLAHGDHGDKDIVTVMSSPWLSIQVMVARKLFDSNSINDVVLWGEAKARQSKLGYYEIQNFPLSGSQGGIVYEYTKDIQLPIAKLEWGSSSYHCYDAYLIEDNYGYRFSFCSVEKIWVDAENLFLKLIESIELNK